MKTILFLLSPLLLLDVGLLAQNDTTMARRSSSRSDTRLEALYDLIGQTRNPDSSLYYYSQVAGIVLSSENYADQIQYYVKYSDFLNINGLYDKGLEMLIKANDVLEARKKSFTQESFNQSYYRINQAFATWHYYLGDYDNALMYETRCLKTSLERNDSTYIGLSYSNVAESYTELGKYDSALYCLFKAIDYFNTPKTAVDSLYYFIAIHNIGRTYTRTRDYELAGRYLHRSLRYNKAIEDQEGLAYDYHEIGNLHLAKNSVPAALAYYDSALENVFDASLKLKILKGIYDASLTENDLTKTGQAMQTYFSFKDSVLNEEKLRRITQLHLLESIKEYDEKLLQAKLRADAIQYFTIGGLALTFIVIGVLLYRHRLNQKTNREKERLFKEIDTLKSRFFANISHEFRTPLTLLLSPIEKRLSESEDPQDKAELALMHRSASRLLTLVNQLLDLSRLETGKLKIHCRQLELSSFIYSITSQFKSLGDSRKIHFNVQVPQDIRLYADPDQLGIILSNLLSNAFKFTPPEGNISLTARTGKENENFIEGYVELEVKDSGIGIKPEHHEKVFERFFQVDDSTTRAHEGSGIGLALTKELVELHHGTVSVASAPGLGSLFTVRLPLGKAHLKDEEIVEGEPLGPTLNLVTETIGTTADLDDHETDPHPKLLVVEDSDDLSYYLQENFRKDYHVLRAGNGEEGWHMALQEIPDVILSDVMMPRMDGFHLCEHIKKDERTSHIPVVLLTAKTDQPSKIEGLGTGADDYVAKPFDLAELKLRIRNLVESRKKLQARFSRHFDLKPSEIIVESMDDRFVKKVLEAIEKHMEDSSFGVEVLAREMAMSAPQLYRKLKALTDYKPVDLIRHIRLERAASLLKQHAGNVAEVAYQVGFNNLSYFAKVFREKYGVTPSDYTGQ
jgi:signal transduction histidine kinase/DNA-binding response OmpR family regulator